LPGLTVEVLAGPPAVTDGAARDVPCGSLFLASDPRRFLEGLGRGRGWTERVVPQQEVEVQFDKMRALRGEHRRNDLRDACRTLAGSLDMRAEVARQDGIVGAQPGSRAARNPSPRQSVARAAGRPCDPSRLELFDTLFSALSRELFAATADLARHASHARASAPSNHAFPTTAKARRHCRRGRNPRLRRPDHREPMRELARPLVAAMTIIQSWSAAFDLGVPRDQLRARLAACHAFEEDLKSHRLVFPERTG
jgi:hypothetical protein